MINPLKESLWKQFGASMDMLKNAISLWPDERWHSDRKSFYMAYHTLFFLDYYLTFPPKGFEPLLPCTETEPKDAPAEAIDDLIPNTIYSKQELLSYLQACREKCHRLIADLTLDGLNDRWIEDPGNPKSRDFSKFELLMYNMRHVQHHAAQLNLLLRQQTNSAPRWVSRAKEEV